MPAAQVELVGSEFDPNAVVAAGGGAEGEDKPKKQTMGGRIREALTGGRKKDTPEQVQKGKVDKKGAGKKITTPRKAGGA